MERYYCQIVPDSLNHSSPSVSMLLEELDTRQQMPKSILDIGCGNGRNAVTLASRFDAHITAVDPDQEMLDWALKSFAAPGRESIELVKASLEQIATGTMALRDHQFDVVILSYVLQHVDPSYYPAIFDFLRDICRGYLLIDIFWNPSRCEPGGTVITGRTTWHGIRYEDLVQLIAPRFEIIKQRIQVNRNRVIINVLARQGITPPENVIVRDFNYYLGELEVVSKGWSPRPNRKSRVLARIEAMPNFVLLSSFYPTEMDLVKTQLSDWLRGSEDIRNQVVATGYLRLCRANGVPVYLREVLHDFGVRPRSLFGSHTYDSYVPPLKASRYIERASMQLRLGAAIADEAKKLESGSTVKGSSPTVRAGQAILVAAMRARVKLRTEDVASCLGVSSTALRMGGLGKQKRQSLWDISWTSEPPRLSIA